MDDEPDGREILALHLRHAGFDVVTADSGGRALEMVAKEPFDAVVLDIMMPMQSGMDVLAGIRSAHSASELPVLMATARDDTRDLVEALECGANDYITKPLDLAVLLARLRTHLSLKAAMQRVLELERQLGNRNRELEDSNQKLEEANARMSGDLRAAAAVQRSLLPSSVPLTDRAKFSWAFRPTSELAGDNLNVFELDSGTVGLYVLDVSGHGVAAALLSVTVARFLSPGRDPASLLWRPELSPRDGATTYRPATPAEVVAGLNRRFPFDFANNQYFTIAYALLSPDARQVTLANAGHPSPILIPQGGAGKVIDHSGYPVGVDLMSDYEQHTIDLSPGDRLFLYTDGVTDALSPRGEKLGTAGVLSLIESARNLPLEQAVASVAEVVDTWCGRGHCKDDVTVLALEVT